MARVRMYSTRFCVYCAAARRLLSARGIQYDAIDVSHDPDTRRWLVGATGQSTVPQIFIDDRSIGGYTELAALDRSGELRRLVGEP